MFELISSNPKLFIGVFAPLMLAMGYFYRARREKKENLRKALYILLEIWHRMAVLYRQNFDSMFDVFAKEIRKAAPEEEFTVEQQEATRKYFTPILLGVARSSAFSDMDDFQELFDEAVRLISVDDPLFAYHIGSAGKTKKFLSEFNGYVDNTLKPLDEEGGDSLILSSAIKSHISLHVSKDVLIDLEKNVRRIAFRVGIITFLKSCSVIRARKNKLEKFSESEIKELVGTVLAPMLLEFNKQRQATT